MTLPGYKTYIIAGLVVALSVAHKMGYVDDQTFQLLYGVLTGGGLATLRAGVKKAEP